MLEVTPEAIIVIKSTIPVGYTRSLYVKYAKKLAIKDKDSNCKLYLLFSPEFLRESQALYDNLYPSRIIVGYPKIIRQPEFWEENEAIIKMAGNHMEEYAKPLPNSCRKGLLKRT